MECAQMHRVAGLALLALAAACGSETPNNDVVCQTFGAGRSHIEVVADGVVTRVLGTQPGVSSPHEGFLMRLQSGCNLVVRVEANESFTGVIPLNAGERVTVKGEYEYYPLGGVIHWTHRDPRGRHPDGYVIAGSTRYQ
jgi:uncharacterized protein DUF3465